jgi:hypothetical protein
MKPVMQGRAAQTGGKIEDFGPFIFPDARLFRRKHRNEQNAFVQGMDMFEMKGECKRNTGGSRREERRGAREADGRQAGYGVGMHRLDALWDRIVRKYLLVNTIFWRRPTSLVL